jgi:hypothetical protein
MNSWIELHISMLRDVDSTMTSEQRLAVAILFEQHDTMLTERTKALQLIGHMIGAGAGCDLVHELPQLVFDVVKEKGSL